MAAGSLEFAAALPADYQEVEEPARALFLVPPPAVELSEQQYKARQLAFDYRTGGFQVRVGQDSQIAEWVGRSDFQAYQAKGFKRMPRPHITILDYENGQRLIRSLDGRRSRLRAVEAEAKGINWSWRLLGEPVPLRAHRQSSLKIVKYVYCPGVDEFFGRLEDQLPGLQLVRDPPHITLMRRPIHLRHMGDLMVGGISTGRPLRHLSNPRIAGACYVE